MRQFIRQPRVSRMLMIKLTTLIIFIYFVINDHLDINLYVLLNLQQLLWNYTIVRLPLETYT